jgi:hypothetical protein
VKAGILAASKAASCRPAGSRVTGSQDGRLHDSLAINVALRQ